MSSNTRTLLKRGGAGDSGGGQSSDHLNSLNEEDEGQLLVASQAPRIALPPPSKDVAALHHHLRISVEGAFESMPYCADLTSASSTAPTGDEASRGLMAEQSLAHQLVSIMESRAVDLVVTQEEVDDHVPPR